MKKLSFYTLLLLLLTGTQRLAAQTADDIVQRHIAAMGGIDNWRKVTSLKMIGTSNAAGMEIPITMTFLQGKGFRVEYTVNGMTGYSIITDKAGWTFNPFGGQTKPDVIPDETIKEAQDALYIGGPLIDYQAKGNKVEYVGKDEVEGTECYKLKVTYKSGKEETVYIDVANLYHIRSIGKAKANGKEVETTSNYGDFRRVPEGLIFPMSIDNGGGPVTIKTLELNKPIDESIFRPSEDVKK